MEGLGLLWGLENSGLGFKSRLGGGWGWQVPCKGDGAARPAMSASMHSCRNLETLT